MLQSSPGSITEQTHKRQEVYAMLLSVILDLQHLMIEKEPTKIVMIKHDYMMFEIRFLGEDVYIQIAAYAVSVNRIIVQANTYWPDSFPYINWEIVPAILATPIYTAQTPNLFKGENNEVKS